jgi:hypothetical protein
MYFSLGRVVKRAAAAQFDARRLVFRAPPPDPVR